MQEPTIKIGRRAFTAAGVMALLSGVTVTIWGCGSTSTPSSPTSSGGTGTTTDLSGTISANHGHIATITAAELTAKNAVTLNIQGNATHNHTVALTADQVAAAASRQTVSVTSSTDNSHNHTVTFN